MHDLHEADRIFKIALEQAKISGLKNIKSITIELGTLIEHGEEISPENLEFNLKMLAEGTIAEGWQINIIKTKGESWILKEIEGEK
ncbi:hydrogenase maturation nickel metallochaperone HypA [Patescibacteria group bacterium]|nr:hydrogenase maturation nickel metallochaperone HypA [Patescibacteria group bacterium]MBU1673073.1 hydrogenase maturation nickel metallochaperone HypA [Patescibacteria group bacterium]MBU1963679.1 hydrogenase maturation nickel metallochaperone HypA [Patescibacteria group bacterium]